MIRTIEQIVMSYAIRYTKLSEMIAIQFNNSQYAGSDKINIFIDVTKIIRSVNIEIMNGYKDDDNYYSLCASLLNLCAHYKNFFNSGYNVSTNIFLLYTSENFIYNTKHVKEYKYYGKFITHRDMTCFNLDILADVCKFLPNIYFISTGTECIIPMYDILVNKNDSTPSIFITKDPYNWQSIMLNGVSIFVPVKYKGNDNSYIVDGNNIYEALCHVRNCKYNNYGLSPLLYPVLLAMTKVPERGLHQLKSINFSMKWLRSCIDKFIIPNSYIAPITGGIDMNNDTIMGMIDGSGINGFELRERLLAIDMQEQYNTYRYLRNVSTDMDYTGLVDMVDPAGIEYIDRKYFQKSKVDFGTLMI